MGSAVRFYMVELSRALLRECAWPILFKESALGYHAGLGLVEAVRALFDRLISHRHGTALLRERQDEKSEGRQNQDGAWRPKVSPQPSPPKNPAVARPKSMAPATPTIRKGAG